MTTMEIGRGSGDVVSKRQPEFFATEIEGQFGRTTSSAQVIGCDAIARLDIGLRDSGRCFQPR